MMYDGCNNRVLALVGAVMVAASALTAHAEVQPGQVLIQAVKGDATYASTDGIFKPLKENSVLAPGTTIKTGKDSTIDFILQYNGSSIRLTPDSQLSFRKLDKESAGDTVITETSLDLVNGSLIGSQRKLASPSRFEISLPGGGLASIKGTEYLVRADGAVIVLSGSVSVVFNLPHNGGSVKVSVGAGFTFDPVSGQVNATSASDLHNIIGDINTVRANAQVFKTGGATVVVRAEPVISPDKGNNGVGNGIDPQPPGNPPVNDGPGTGPGNPGNKGKGRQSNRPRTPQEN